MWNHKIIFYVFSISVCASWGALRKPYIILAKHNASGGRDPPRGAIFVILAIFIDLRGNLVKLAKIREISLNVVKSGQIPHFYGICTSTYNLNSSNYCYSGAGGGKAPKSPKCTNI